MDRIREFVARAVTAIKDNAKGVVQSDVHVS